MTNDGFAIRTAEGADLPALALLGAKTFVDTFGFQYSEADLEAFLIKNHTLTVYRKLFNDPRYAIWVAEQAERLVGYSVAGPSSLPVPQPAALDGEIKRLYVHRDYQNAGLGSLLLAPTLDWLKANYRALYLSVYAENHGARRLYERHGFALHHRYEFMVGDHADPELILRYGHSTES